ncbi:WD40-repeat-containing domain protein [Scheffersomyces coipomensis]|uniref:WD40-repeat-containing domain protein n=1 Tax=Scheffersomyces coipomensis TaxID=1788519 RepID=UPI00315D3AEB
MSSSNQGQRSSSSTIQLTEKVISSFRPAKKFDYHQGASITSLDFDETGQYLISAGIDKSIQLYDTHKGTHHKDIKSQKYGAHLARFTHHELNCLYASTPSLEDEANHAIRYLSLADNQYIRYFKGHKEQVTSIEVHPISDTFLSSSLDHTVKYWDLRSSSPVGNIVVGQSSIIAFDPWGMIFVVGRYPDPNSSSKTGTVSFYDVKTLDKAPFLQANVEILPKQKWTKIEFSNNGKLVLIVTDSPVHYILDSFSGQLITTLQLDPKSEESFNGDWFSFEYPSSGSATFSPCGKFVLAGTPQSTVQVFNLTDLKSTDGKSHHISPYDNPKILRPLTKIPSPRGLPKILAFNPKLLNVATADTTVSLWLPNL